MQDILKKSFKVLTSLTSKLRENCGRRVLSGTTVLPGTTP